MRPENRMDAIYAHTISIHAPVKGATGVPGLLIQRSSNFNPRTREGCDSGVRLSGRPSLSYFNPRTREGCDDVADSPDFSAV